MAGRGEIVAVVDFYLGLGSRYSYLAASQLDRISAQHGATSSGSRSPAAP